MKRRMKSLDRLILVDGHVHVHECFDLARFLDSAYSNFEVEAARRGSAEEFDCALLLSEDSDSNWFSQMRQAAGQPLGSNANWMFDRTDEDCSVLARRAGKCPMVVVAGRQIVTVENLEVLALATSARIEDGAPIDQVIEAVRASSGVVVLPWGAGKWLGSRGSVVRRLIESNNSDEIFLGNNSARPVFWREPAHFRLARAKGIRILPGSDPLPFPSEDSRAGSFGFAVYGYLDPAHPARDLRHILKDPATKPDRYGSLERPARFFRNQIAMQLRKRVRQRAAAR